MNVEIPTFYYQQFDADYSLDVPAEGFHGWQKSTLPFDLDHTALVVMHAWDTGTYERFPGWYKYVEYLPRANKICDKIFPDLLKTVRKSPMQVFHVVGSGDYYKNYHGYNIAKKTSKKIRKFLPDKVSNVRKSKNRIQLDRFRSKNAGQGLHNRKDIARGFKNIDFAKNAFPIKEEGIAENSRQLAGLCKKFRIDHLIYIGFAINWCLLLSPGGMAEMSKYGLLCSTIKDATTAVENDFSARNEVAKKIALWRIALSYGFVFEIDDFLDAIKTNKF